MQSGFHAGGSAVSGEAFVMSTETKFSILGGCKFCAYGEGSHKDFEVNTLDETSRGTEGMGTNYTICLRTAEVTPEFWN